MDGDNLAIELLKTLKTTIKRLWVAVVILIALIFSTNMIWLYYWNLPIEEETCTVTQDAEDEGTNNYIGENGDIYGETDGYHENN